jgi:hypothetical protein
MKKMCLPTLLLVLGFLTFSPPVIAAPSPGAETSFAAEVFSSGEVAFAGDADKEESPSFLGSALLLLGVVLLAASGRQYAGQFAMANAELQNLREGLEALVDDSVRVDGGQHEQYYSRLESLRGSHRQLTAELQNLRGGFWP